MGNLREEFNERFGSKLAHRRDSFWKLVEMYALNAHNLPFIIETGTARERGNFSGDGQSTLIWDFVVSRASVPPGEPWVWSLDISPQYCAEAKAQVSDRVKFIVGDSVFSLTQFTHMQLQGCGLLYLDSFDLDQNDPLPSALHHLKELTAVYSSLRPGCLIAVDDCLSDALGKHLFVAEFMKHTNCELVHRGYQFIWKKL